MAPLQNIGNEGIQYRLYAIYAQESDECHIKQVNISDSAGQVFK